MAKFNTETKSSGIRSVDYTQDAEDINIPDPVSGERQVVGGTAEEAVSTTHEEHPLSPPR